MGIIWTYRLAPTHLAMSLSFIWRSGTRWCNLRVPDPQKSGSDLLWVRGCHDNIPAIATKPNLVFIFQRAKDSLPHTFILSNLALSVMCIASDPKKRWTYMCHRLSGHCASLVLMWKFIADSSQATCFRQWMKDISQSHKARLNQDDFEIFFQIIVFNTFVSAIIASRQMSYIIEVALTLFD